MEATRICRYCNEEKNYPSKFVGINRRVCKVCFNEREKDDKLAYRAKTKVKTAVYNKAYKIANKEKLDNNEKTRIKQTVRDLTDTYVARCMGTHDKISSITIKQFPELINAKRQQMLLLRECQQ